MSSPQTSPDARQALFGLPAQVIYCKRCVMSNQRLDVRDKSVTMLGTSGAVVTCLWTQSQTYKGVPETASGRMTLVFKRVGTAWKAIHLHSSPDTPNPAAIPPSEQRPAASPSPTP